MEQMREVLSEEDQEAFASGLLNIVLTEYPPAQGLEGAAFIDMIEEATDAAHVTLDGWSLDQIIERGRSLENSSTSDSR